MFFFIKKTDNYDISNYKSLTLSGREKALIFLLFLHALLLFINLYFFANTNVNNGWPGSDIGLYHKRRR